MEKRSGKNREENSKAKSQKSASEFAKEICPKKASSKEKK